MRFFVFPFLFSFLLLGPSGFSSPAFAQNSDGSNQVDVEGTQEGDDLEQLDAREDESLNSLFDDLRRQTNPKAASRISRKIWNKWGESGSDSIDLLMSRIGQAMNDNKNNVAMDLLDQVITLAPDYAEGWNRRATLHYGLRQFGRSISDIERALLLEPRHFGALSGLAVMLQALKKDEKALETWYKVLAIYPANDQAQKSIITLEDKLAGNPT
jgi:tetratricopeptide (TPR) repeat protein